MRKITKTHTGIIVSDTDMSLEYLYVGDYGKENNIKANFLGYTKRIDKVEHRDVDLTDKAEKNHDNNSRPFRFRQWLDHIL